MKPKFKSLLALLLFFGIMLSFTACGVDSPENNDEKNTQDKYINYPDGVKINIDPWWHWEISPTYIDFETYDDLYKFTSCVYYNNSTEKHLGSDFYDVFGEEEYKVFTSNLLIPVQLNGDYTIRRIWYKDRKAFRVLTVSFDVSSENGGVEFSVYEKNERSLAEVSENLEDILGNRQEKITVGNYEIPMYFGFYSTSSQENFWFGYCITSNYIIRVAMSSDGTKDVAAGLEMAKDFEFIPLTEYPNLQK